MPSRAEDEVDQVIAELAAERGEVDLNGLVAGLYDDLRRLATLYMSRERRDHTLQATALVHEVYLRLSRQREVDWRDRVQFFALASRMIRRILIDHARTKRSTLRGGDRQAVPLSQAEALASLPDVDLLALDEALERLAEINPRHAEVVELRYFGGLSIDEIATVLDMGRRSVDREWSCAKAWLYRELCDEQ